MRPNSWKLIASAALAVAVMGSTFAHAQTLRLAHGAAPANPRHEAALRFAELVEENTDGDITVTVFPSGQLGDERQSLEALASGAIDFALAGTPLFAAYAPELELLDMPYLFTDVNTAWEVLDGPLGAELTAPLVDSGFQVLAFWENGLRHITNDVRPINTPADIDGLKLRVAGSRVRLATFEAFGASPVPISFSELYLALSQGVVDGQENPLANIHSARFAEVQGYLTLSGHVYGALPLAVASSTWEDLSEDHRAAIMAAAEAARDFHRQRVQELEAELLAELEEAGMEVNAVEDSTPFQDIAREVWGLYREQFGDEAVDHVIELAGAN